MTHKQFNTLTDILKQASEIDGAGITFIEGTDQSEFLTYKDLYQSSLKVLGALQSKGIHPLDELVFQLDNNKTFVITFWACILGGIIPIPITIGLNDDHKLKLFNIWKILNNPHLIVNEENLFKLKSYAALNNFDATYSQMIAHVVSPAEVMTHNSDGECCPSSENDIAFIQFSSGSTGNPKGVILTHRNLILNMQAISNAAGYKRTDSSLSWMPLTHDMGLIGFHLNPTMEGMNQYLIPTSLFVRKPSLWLQKASDVQATILCSPNFGFRYVLKHCQMDNPQPNWNLSSVRVLYNGAEPISTNLCKEFINALKGSGLPETAMRPVYGLAEASLAVSISKLSEEVLAISLDRNKLNIGDQLIAETFSDNLVSFVNVGKVVDHCSIRITNDIDQPVAEQILGHIQIRGENVTAGYYNNSEQTNAAFSSEGWLKTGDIGFLLKEQLYVTGRAKDLIIINGQNYYPHDIERVAEEVDGVELNKVAVAGFFNEQTGGEEKIAFVFHRGSIENFVPIAQELRSLISEKLGIDFDHVIPVKDIPRTTSGKLQRFKLLDQYKSGKYNSVINQLSGVTDNLDVSRSIQQPKTNLEQQLLDIWKKVLPNESFGITHNFFEIGGDSLKAAEIAMLTSKKMRIEISFETFFKCQTIERLAAEIEQMEESIFQSIPLSGQSHENYPLTSAQARIYYACIANPSSVAYNIPLAFQLNGEINTERLQYAIQRLIQRHDVLRMTFQFNTEPSSIIRSHVEFTLSAMDCSQSEVDKKLKELVCPFNLHEGPLFRIALLKTGANSNILFIDFHHIISDGRSIHQFITELGDLYCGKILPLQLVQYHDYALWEKNHLASRPLLNQRNFWMNSLDGDLPKLDMPLDFVRPPLFDTRGGKMEFVLNASIRNELKKIATENNCTLHVALFTIYNVLLWKYTHQNDRIIGVPVTGRRHPELQHVQGMFVNNLAMRHHIQGSESFLELLSNLQNQFVKALDNQDYSFDALLNDLGNKRDISRNPVFDSMFVFQDSQLPMNWNSDISIQRYFFDPGFSKFDVSIEIFNEQNSLTYYIEYASNLFCVETIERIGKHFAALIEQVTIQPQCLLKDLLVETLDMQNDSEQEANNAPASNENTIDQLIDLKAQTSPENVAIHEGGSQISYKQLRNSYSRLAFILRERGIMEEDIIGLLLPRSSKLITSMLGVLRVGAAYLPMDVDLPIARIEHLISDSRCKIVVTNREYAKNIESLRNKLIFDIIIVEELDLISENLPVVRESYALPCGLAYVIYTSGTTGKPKGVMIQHDTLVNYISWAMKEYVKDEPVNFPFHTSPSFDLTVTSIFTPLLTGNTMIIYKEDKNEVSIQQVVRDNKSQVIKLTPSHLKVIEAMEWSKDFVPVVKRFIVGGEQLDSNLAKRIVDKFNNQVEIYNEYGPTEATVGCMIHQFEINDNSPNVPIGLPAPNTRIYILDQFLKPVPTGVYGEVYISGDCLARGYLFNENLSVEKFINDPFHAGNRMYKSGDLARKRDSGIVEYKGRVDQQIKINGYRVELPEIEQVLTSYSSISQACVTYASAQNKKMLCAYYVSQSSVNEENEIRDHLAERLPNYMIPNRLIKIDQIPLTRNGKIDYLALPVPLHISSQSLSTDSQPVTRQEEVMMNVWKDILNENDIGLDDNFFELGGDSIKAVQIASRLYAEGISVEIRDILTYHTIRKISKQATFIRATMIHDDNVVKGDKGRTPIEEWFFERNFPIQGYYNQSILLQLVKKTPVEIIEQAFDLVIKKHDGLRLNYDENNKAFFNEGHLNNPFRIQTIQLDTLDELPEVCTRIRQRLDLSVSLLIKAALINHASTSMLFITAHHLIIDGVSWRILLEDLKIACDALMSDSPVALSGKTSSLQAWANQLEQYAKSEYLRNESHYWEALEETNYIIQDFDVDDWRFRNARKKNAQLNNSQTDTLLKEGHRVYKADALVLLNTALAQTLYEWIGLKSFVIEQEGHGRTLDNIDISQTIGWFTSIYPVRLTLKGETISDQITSIKEQLKEIPKGGIGYGIAKQACLLDQLQQPISEIRFNYLGQFDRQFNNDLFSYTDHFTGPETALENSLTAKLEFNIMIIDGQLRMELIYNQLAYKSETIDFILESFMMNLSKILIHIENVNDIYFTASDFAADLSNEELDALFL